MSRAGGHNWTTLFNDVAADTSRLPHRQIINMISAFLTRKQSPFERTKSRYSKIHPDKAKLG